MIQKTIHGGVPPLPSFIKVGGSYPPENMMGDYFPPPSGFLAPFGNSYRKAGALYYGNR